MKLHKKYRQRKLAKGVCGQCGCHSPLAPGHTMCEYHLLEMREVARERRRSRVKQGLCHRCGKQPHTLGTQLCLECRKTYYGARFAPKSVLTPAQRRAIREYNAAELDKQLLQTWDEVVPMAEERLDEIEPGRDVERNRAMIRKYFGLTGDQPRTLEELGTEYGLTRERVRQLVKRFAFNANDLGLYDLRKWRRERWNQNPALQSNVVNRSKLSLRPKSLLMSAGSYSER